jgi:flagellar motor switch protein FliG
MSPAAESLRKVAVVLASLDAETADALIDRMPEERARQVRQALLELDQLDPAEQEAVVAEFLRQGQAAKQADLAGVEVEAGLAQRLELAGPTYQASPLPATPPPPALAEVATPDREDDGKDTAQDDPARDGELFAFLHQLDADELVLHLEHERPQTLAVVVAYLPSDRSAELVSRLPSETQAEVLRRVAELGELDPQMVREVEWGVRQRLAEHTATPRPRRRGTSAVASILKSAGHEARRQLLQSLAAHEPEFAARFAPPQAAEPSLAFDDLANLSELALAKIFAECDADVLILALAGAHPSFARRVLDQLPAREARSLRRQLDGLGPTRLSDVERAQHDVVAVALRLHTQGSIELGARRRLSLTV